jgi:hypothetical protein
MHQCHLQISDGLSAVQKRHEVIEVRRHPLAFLNQSQVVPYEDGLPIALLNRDKLQIRSYAGGLVIHNRFEGLKIEQTKRVLEYLLNNKKTMLDAGFWMLDARCRMPKKEQK